MTRPLALVVLLSLVALAPSARAQSFFADNLDARGYLKYLSTVLVQDVDSVVTDNLIHNRLNVRLRLPSGFRVGIEARNRIFYGQLVSSTPGYGDLVTDYDGVLPLEILWVDGTDLVANTIIDRAWLEYRGPQFETRIGRQRINWGISPVWNPNDLFNAFNYLDFDYEERPGADAARFAYYTGDAGSVEVAYKLAKESSENVGGLMYRFNTSGYDIQLLAGRFQQDWAAGGGWAGSIGYAGFKGEGTVFVPSSDAPDTSDVAVSATVAAEYAFQNGWTTTASYLLNSEGVDGSAGVGAFLLFEPNAKRLMPNRHTVFVSAGRQLSPLSSINVAGFYAFEVNWVIFYPTFTYWVATNWDLAVVGQLFWGEEAGGGFSNQGNALFFRVKWSF